MTSTRRKSNTYDDHEEDNKMNTASTSVALYIQNAITILYQSSVCLFALVNIGKY